MPADDPPSDDPETDRPNDDTESADGTNGGDDAETVELLGATVGRRTLHVAVAVLAVLSLLYSLLIAGQILLWVALIAPFVFLYLLWRFVRAHERIAAAQERRATAAERE